MAARATGRRPATRDETSGSTASRLGGLLRGPMNSISGAAGFNIALRAVERLTRAIEHATQLLERLERATLQLDLIDEEFVERVSDTLDVLMDVGDDTQAIRQRLDSLEADVRQLRVLLAKDGRVSLTQKRPTPSRPARA